MYNWEKSEIILNEIAERFVKAKYDIYLVGGAVRDIVLGKIPHDFDIATNARPEQVKKLFNKVIPTGIDHGTVTILFKKMQIECTTFRSETIYSDGRHPDAIHYAQTIEEDLSRRDFTMNAIAIKLPEGTVVDPYNGQKHIKKKIIRTVGNPYDRFAEDGLRSMRAIRFASQLNFKIESNTFAAINPSLDILKKVSIERINIEFSKILTSDFSYYGLTLMEKTGILQVFIPELAACRNIKQNPIHRFDVLDHLFFACEKCPSKKIELKLACLLHDIGKSIIKKKEQTSFCAHEQISAQIACSILERFYYPTKIKKHVVHLIKNQKINYSSKWTDATVRRFIVRIGVDNLDNFFIVSFADAWAITGTKPPESYLGELKKRIQEILDAKNALTLKDLAINGNDLIAIGIPKGKVIGKILNDLLEAVLDDPNLNTKQKLILIAKKIKKINSNY